MINTKNRILLIKLVFGLALLLFIAWKILLSTEKEEFGLMKVHEGSSWILLLVGLLVFVNSLFEVIKWHILVIKISPQSFSRSILDVLAGVSTSIMTPNRIGNFIGRTISLQKDVKTKAIIGIIHANLAQFIASIMFGTAALLVIGLNSDWFKHSMVILSASVILCTGILLYLFPKLIDFNPLSRLYSDQMKSGIEYVQAQKISFKGLILLLSICRYTIYLVQFYLLLKVFGADGSWNQLVPAISIVFLITTIIPSFLFGKLFIREVSALFVLEPFGIAAPVILAAVFILWFINLALPALAGGIILMKK